MVSVVISRVTNNGEHLPMRLLAHMHRFSEKPACFGDEWWAWILAQENFLDWWFIKIKPGIWVTNQFFKAFRKIWKGPQLQSYGQWFTNWGMTFSYPIFKICILPTSVNRSLKHMWSHSGSTLSVQVRGHLAHTAFFTCLVWECGSGWRCLSHSSGAGQWETAP